MFRQLKAQGISLAAITNLIAKGIELGWLTLAIDYCCSLATVTTILGPCPGPPDGGGDPLLWRFLFPMGFTGAGFHGTTLSPGLDNALAKCLSIP